MKCFLVSATCNNTLFKQALTIYVVSYNLRVEQPMHFNMNRCAYASLSTLLIYYLVPVRVRTCLCSLTTTPSRCSFFVCWHALVQCATTRSMCHFVEHIATSHQRTFVQHPYCYTHLTIFKCYMMVISEHASVCQLHSQLE